MIHNQTVDSVFGCQLVDAVRFITGVVKHVWKPLGQLETRASICVFWYCIEKGKASLSAHRQSGVGWVVLKGAVLREHACSSVSLLVFWLANFGMWDCQCCQRSQSRLSSEACVRPPCSLLTFSCHPPRVIVLEKRRGFTDLQDSFSSHTFASPRLWVSLLGVIPGHCLCVPLAHLSHWHETDPRERLSILNVSLAQWFFACSHNYGQWGVVIHERIQLLSTFWQPGGRWVWLPHWLVRFISLCKNCHVPFWCCSLVPFSQCARVKPLPLITSSHKSIWKTVMN